MTPEQIEQLIKDKSNGYAAMQGTHDKPEITRHDFIEGMKEVLLSPSTYNLIDKSEALWRKLEDNDKVEFGDYISVEQKRFGAKNEFYTHKVIGTLKTNTWMDVPAITHNGMVIHNEMEDVVSCICCGVSETEVIRYRVKDIHSIMKYLSPSSIPSGEALMEENKKMKELLNEFSKLLDTLILRLPTGEQRNQVCDLNIEVKSLTIDNK